MFYFLTARTILPTSVKVLGIVLAVCSFGSLVLLGFHRYKGWHGGAAFLIACATLGSFRGVGSPAVLPSSLSTQIVNGTAQVSHITIRGQDEELSLQVRSVDDGQRLRTVNVLATAERPLRQADDNLKSGDDLQFRGHLLPEGSQTALSIQPTYSLIGQVDRASVGEDTSFADVFKAHVLQQVSTSQSAKGKVEISLINSLLFGGTALPTTTHDLFLRAGVLHILAASGANVLLLSTLVRFVYRHSVLYIIRSRYIYFASLMAALWTYGLFCDFTPSILRALLMATYAEVGNVLHRPVHLMAGFATALFLESISAPSTIYSQSTVLSYAATFAVFFAVRLFRRMVNERRGRKQNWGKNLLQKGAAVVVVSVLVEVITVPITLLGFQQFTPYSILGNIVSEPIIAVLLPAAVVWWVTLVLSLAVPCLTAVSALLTESLEVVVNGFLWILTKIADLPGSLVQILEIPWWWVVIYYGIIIFIVFLWRKLHSVKQASNLNGVELIYSNHDTL